MEMEFSKDSLNLEGCNFSPPKITFENVFTNILEGKVRSLDLVKFVDEHYKKNVLSFKLTPVALESVIKSIEDKQSKAIITLHGRAKHEGYQPVSISYHLQGSRISYVRSKSIPSLLPKFTSESLAAARMTVDFASTETDYERGVDQEYPIEVHRHPLCTALLCLEGNTRYFIKPYRDPGQCLYTFDMGKGDAVLFSGGVLHTCCPLNKVTLLNCTAATNQPKIRNFSEEEMKGNELIKPFVGALEEPENEENRFIWTPPTNLAKCFKAIRSEGEQEIAPSNLFSKPELNKQGSFLTPKDFELLPY
jgi:hypothetical protein